MPVFGVEVSNERMAEALTLLVTADLSRYGMSLDVSASEFLRDRLSENLARFPEPVTAHDLMQVDDQSFDKFEANIGPFGVLYFSIGRLSQAIGLETTMRGDRIVSQNVTESAFAGLCPLPPIC